MTGTWELTCVHLYGPFSALNPTHLTVCCDLFHRPPHMPGCRQEKKRKTSENFLLLQELRITEFAGGKTGTYCQIPLYLRHLEYGICNQLRKAFNYSEVCWLLLPHFKTFTLHIGSLCEENHYWPRVIGSARQDDLKLKEK
ncbi:hypothetical protein HJG60_011236 [Phyllostomus discolor]|uniref:Uncharacterized protein n=1 Tax=Phyllostomus discolor TaxID=89673 RepID=A0A834A2A7_9CHIR|nr:hypothetical protein HJG60_011236 [Phyllostomus discolor]